MMASVGRSILGSSRSSTRTSPGAWRTAPRMTYFLSIAVVAQPSRRPGSSQATPFGAPVAGLGYPGLGRTCLRRVAGRSVDDVDNRSEVREFLATRRAKLSPDRAGVPLSGRRRRVPGLRREEVAQLAGLSTDYYTRLEK